MPTATTKYQNEVHLHIYTKILEVNLFAFTYRLFHEDFSVDWSPDEWRKLHETACRLA